MRGLGGREQVYSWRESIDGAMIHHVREDKRQAVCFALASTINRHRNKILRPHDICCVVEKIGVHPPTYLPCCVCSTDIISQNLLHQSNEYLAPSPTFVLVCKFPYFKFS